MDTKDLGQYVPPSDVQDISQIEVECDAAAPIAETVAAATVAAADTVTREHDYILPTIERYSPYSMETEAEEFPLRTKPGLPGADISTQGTDSDGRRRSLSEYDVFRLPEIEMHLWHITYRDQRGKYTGSNLVFDPRTTEIARTILKEVVHTSSIHSAYFRINAQESLLPWLYRTCLRLWQTYVQPMLTDDDVFDVDTFIDHIQSYILRDYDIKRLDHQPETKHIEWKNLYWMGYAYHLHVVVSRAEHPTLDMVKE